MEPAVQRVGSLDHRARACGRQSLLCLAVSSVSGCLSCMEGLSQTTDRIGQDSEPWSLLYEGWEAWIIALYRAAGSVSGVWLPLMHVRPLTDY